MGASGSSSIGRTGEHASARNCELHCRFNGDSNLYRVEKFQIYR